MRKLADYQGEDALELWADLMEPIARILSDKTMEGLVRSGKPPVFIAKEVMKHHKKEAVEIALRVDPTPVNGINLPVRVLNFLFELEKAPELKGFFDLPGQEQGNPASGSAMESTEAPGTSNDLSDTPKPDITETGEQMPTEPM